MPGKRQYMSQKDSQTNIHCILTHNSQTLETTQISINRMDHQIVVHSHNETLLSDKKTTTTTETQSEQFSQWGPGSDWKG